MKNNPSSLLKRISASVSIFIAAAPAILSAIKRIRTDRMLPLMLIWSTALLFFSGYVSDSASQTCQNATQSKTSGRSLRNQDAVQQQPEQMDGDPMPKYTGKHRRGKETDFRVKQAELK